jgi:hypothetical protein
MYQAAHEELASCQCKTFVVIGIYSERTQQALWCSVEETGFLSEI